MELRSSSLGNLLLRQSSLSENSFGRRRQTRRERIQDGGTGGMPARNLRYHEKGDSHFYHLKSLEKLSETRSNETTVML